jgi:uncharacterized protein YtpQ (UPF0354 family)
MKDDLPLVPRPRDASLIVPVIKRQGPPAGEGIVVPPEQILMAEPLVGRELEISYAFDMPGYFQYVSKYDCDALGLDSSGLRQLSILNLTKRRSEPKIRRLSEAMLMLTLDGDLEASLLVIDRLWSRLASALPGELIVAVPSRDVVAVSSTGSVGAVEALRQAVRRAWASPKANKKLLLTSLLLARRDDSWQVFEPPSG